MDRLRILLLNTKLGNLNGYLTTFVREGFEAVVGAENVVLSNYHRCIHDYIQHDCNAVVCFDGQELHTLMAAKLRRITPRMALWLTEDPYEQSRNRRHLSLFDVVFSNDSGSVRFYGQPHVHHLPLAASRTCHRYPVVEDETEYLYDFFFAGTAWPNRIALLRRVIADLRKLRVKLLLPHNEFLKKPDIGLPDFEIDYRLSNADLARVQNRSKIVLHLHRDFSGSGETQTSVTPGPRTFETALSGGFQLAEDVLPELDRYFARDREIAYFSTPEQCVERVKHFLDHPAERVAIARAAQARVEREHLYRHRAAVIMDRLSAVSPRQPAVIPDRRRTVLYVQHNIAGRPPFGGTELHTQATIETLPPHYRALVYYPDLGRSGARRMMLRHDGRDTPITLMRPHDPMQFSDLEREHAFAQLLERFKVDIVHFMHFLHHPFTLLEVARRHGATTIVTMHDFFLLCPRFNLLDADGQFCWKTKPTMAACDIDLHRTDNLDAGSQASRRGLIAHMLSLADAVTCVSRSQWDIVRQAYPHVEQKLAIINPGIDPERFNGSPRPQRPPGGPLRVAALGNFTQVKGADALLETFRHFRGDDRVKFTLLGQVMDPYRAALRRLKMPNLHIAGQYDLGALPAALRSIDVALLASIWPETYALTLSECWAAGVVPIVTDIGALGQRLTDGVNGLKVPANAPDDIAEAIERLLREPELLDRLRAGLSTGSVQTVRAATDAYARVYDRLLEARRGGGVHIDDAERIDSLPLGSPHRRLHRTWARGSAAGAGDVSRQTPGMHLPQPLTKKVMRYYREYGLMPTMRRVFLRIMGKP